MFHSLAKLVKMWSFLLCFNLVVSKIGELKMSPSLPTLPEESSSSGVLVSYYLIDWQHSLAGATMSIQWDDRSKPKEIQSIRRELMSAEFALLTFLSPRHIQKSNKLSATILSKDKSFKILFQKSFKYYASESIPSCRDFFLPPPLSAACWITDLLLLFEP